MSELTSSRLTLDRAHASADAAIEARFLVEHKGFTFDLDLALPGRGVTAIFGHSGSGKTTLLRCLAGLARPRVGRLVVNGEVWLDTERNIFLPTHKRPLGYVFQEASLFPHLSVKKNLRFGLERVQAAQRRVDLSQAAELLGIGHLLERMPADGNPAQSIAGNPDRNETLLDCLDCCLKKLDPRDRALILEYYVGEQKAKIESRRNIAAKLGLTMNAVSIRACRIREKLESCMKTCSVNHE